MGFRLLPEVVLIVSLLVTGAAWLISDHAVMQAAWQRFVFRTDDVSALISRRMREQEDLLRSGVGLLNVAGVVDRRQWHAFVENLALDKSSPGLQGYGFSLIVPPEDKAAHVARIRGEGFPHYDIYPQGAREIYTSIIYLEPFKGRNLRAFGYDMFSEPVRRAAMERARDTGNAAVSGAVTLVQETGKDLQRGFLMYLPVYRSGRTPASVAERRAQVIGYVYSPFRMKDLMQGILGAGDSLINFRIYDGARTSAAMLLHDSADGRPSDTRGNVDFTRKNVIQVGGRQWTLRFAAHSARIAPLTQILPAFVGLAGIIINVLLYLIIRSLMTREKKVTARAAAMSAEIRRGGERYRAVVDTAADAIVLADRAGTVLSFNRAAETIFGYSEQEVLGQNVRILMPDEQRNAHDGYINRYHRTKTSRVLGVGRITEGRRKDGTEFPLHMSLAAWTNDGGEVGFTAILRDITEHLEAQRALAESERQIRLFMDCATDYAIYQLDLDHKIVKWNKGTERLLGYSAEELNGFDVERMFLERERDEGIVAHNIAAAIAQGRYETEGWRVRKDGSRFWVSGIVQPIYEGGTRLIGLAVILRDMTAQRALAEELRQAKERAETAARVEGELRARIEASHFELKVANEGLQKFTSIVAHDLRAPLKRIDAFINVLREDYADRLDAEGEQIMTRINRGATRMTLMLDALLDYSRYNARAIRGKTADLARVLDDVIESCDFGPFESCIRVNAGQPPRVKGDPILLAHVFQNLISNSIKFRRDDDLRVDIDIAESGESVQISVTDNGIGIEPHFADQVFDMFYRLHDEDEYEGTGIGLAVCRKIINDHGGRIWVDKEFEGGTRIFMTLPLATAGEDAPEKRAA